MLALFFWDRQPTKLQNTVVTLVESRVSHLDFPNKGSVGS